MFKRAAVSILLVLASLVIGGALVGFDVISPSVGAIFWIICIIAAIVIFVRSHKKGQ